MGMTAKPKSKEVIERRRSRDAKKAIKILNKQGISRVTLVRSLHHFTGWNLTKCKSVVEQALGEGD